MKDINISVTGIVIKGKEYGRTIGFPTVNLDIKNFEIKEGIYAGSGELGGQIYRAGIVVGTEGNIEAHLIGYSGDAYGERVTLKIEKFLRDFKNFDTEEELIEQIKKDTTKC